jgi:ribose-phosphate pyrophosphokinase
MDKVVLLAEPNSNAWDFAERIQYHIKEEKKVYLALDVAEVCRFKNGEHDLSVRENIREKDIYFVHDSTKSSSDWWAELQLFVNLFHLASVNNVNLVLPDMKYSRQDRKHHSRVPISANALAVSLKCYPRIKKIFTMDLHAPQIQGFYAPEISVETLPSAYTLVPYLREESGVLDLEDLVVVAADKGDVERAENLCTRLNLKNPPANIYKQRELTGSRKIKKMELIGNVKGRRVLIPDDLIDSGNTLCDAAELLQKEGAIELNCYGTHGWFTNGLERLTSLFNRIIVSNTHNKIYDPRVQVMDVSSTFAKAIYACQKGDSLSELWD